MKLESKIGKIKEKDEKVFNFLSNFDNFKHLIPADKARNWESTTDTCRFTIDMIGETGFRILEKEPFKTIKLSNLENTKFDFKFWIQLKEIEENSTAIKLTMETELNPMIEMMAKKPLENFLNTLVERLENMNF